ncbi:asparaginase domain-containing protein [Defluviimonas sp. WL0002]|uniref:Asparaginase domain-containing protein n=1 Tax=Albidovulum marisflavi TaxID=2984159 RepID=A0ABT2Z7K7_9RHOB|nr:asparaginase domain-containing protein [Defluviimonas sp. WL0002]MCV2867007.1 asparaginase domain-containing protein [Defluviimonas sp. WL0002]
MAKILVLHTGGTIGMVSGPDGLMPAAGIVEGALERIKRNGTEIEVRTFEPLVDSAEIGPRHWNIIIDAVAAFEGAGVIVTHGTDTMSFSGAALAQALAGIGVPIVLCGAMHPLNTGGDAEGNLALALDIALGGRPGVWLAFAGRVLPAGGLVKHHSQQADAFRSIQQSQPAVPFRPLRFQDRQLAILTLSPGLSAPAVAAMLAELDGAVLRVFGAGTIMSDPVLESVLRAAVARGCRIRAVSQCESGGLLPGSYAAGAALWRAGCENGGEETPEAALIRLWLDLSR